VYQGAMNFHGREKVSLRDKDHIASLARETSVLNGWAVARQRYLQAIRSCAEIRCRVPRLLLKVL
jgi:hypothetical protein